MRPTAILSCDNTPDYLFLLPIVAESWRLQGFDVLVNMTSLNNEAVISAMPNNVTVIESDMRIASANKAIYTQCIRLYMPLAMNDQKVFVFSDADMFIASDFLQRSFDNGLTCYGKDLTDYHYPICYVMAKAGIWKMVMGNDGMINDLINHSHYTGSKEQSWCADQDILTKKLLAYGGTINHVPRGTDKNNLNLPTGRWDRYGNFRRPSGVIHDVHLMRDPLNHIDKLIDLCTACYPAENWKWIRQYAEEFKR